MKIMFNHNYGLHEATVNGTKTQTRRIIPAKIIDGYCGSKYDMEFAMLLKSPYKIWDIIPIAECYSNIYNRLLKEGKKDEALAFRSSIGDNPELEAGWHNKMFVKSKLMPTAIRINTIRFQRLQDISSNDCMKEGIIEKYHAPGMRNFYYVPGVEVKSKEDVYITPQEAFAVLIDKVSGKGTWDSNPWVWAYSFDVMTAQWDNGKYIIKR